MQGLSRNLGGLFRFLRRAALGAAEKWANRAAPTASASIGPAVLGMAAMLVTTALLLVTIGLVGSFVPAQMAQRGAAGWVIGVVGGVDFTGLASGSFGASRSPAVSLM